MIAVIDYGMGNLRSVQKAFEFIGEKAVITNSRKKIISSDIVVLPGVGSFSSAMENLRRLNLIDTIKRVIHNGKPFLGLCLGLQVLFERSGEGNCKGLGIFKGEVKKFEFSKLKIPHMGWNNIKLKVKGKKLKVFDGLKNNSYFYFVHSYYVVPRDKNIIATMTDYGIDFVSSIFYKNIFATQFHPEKSQKNGLTLLRNFVNYANNSCY